MKFKKTFFLTLSSLFISASLFAEAVYKEELYQVKKGDTLSELLYERGVITAKELYSEDSWVNKNKNRNPNINDWNKLIPGSEITLRYPAYAETQAAYVDVVEPYTVQAGDTLSELLYERGVKGIKRLYAEDGYVVRNKKLNPEVVDWNKLVVGSVIKLNYPELIGETQVSLQQKDSILVADEVKVEEQKPIEELELYKPYFLEHRFLLGMSLHYETEDQVAQTINTKAKIDVPVVQYQLRYRPNGNPDQAAWESRLFIQVHNTLRARGVYLPIGGQAELGFGRYSLLSSSNIAFNPHVVVNAEVLNTVSADAGNNLIARNSNIFWVGFKPELEMYIYSRMLEVVPFIYKSIIVKSMGEDFSAWKFGARANVGIAFDNALFGSAEYNYQTFKNNGPTTTIKSNNMVFGLGYKF